MAVAEGNGASVAELRDELARERRELANSIGDLERSVSIGSRVRAHPWLVRGGALGVGVMATLLFVVRPVSRRRRRDEVVATFGDLVLVRRRR